METHPLINTLLELHRRMTGTPATPSVESRIIEMWLPYRSGQFERSEEATREALEAALRGELVDDVPFFGIGATWLLLEELATLWPGWETEDDGEWREIVLRPLGLRIFISNEAGPPTGRSYSIEPLEDTR